MVKEEDIIILIIDPDEQSLKYTCEEFRKLGIKELICLDNFEDSKTILESSQPIDIVFADVHIDNIVNIGIFFHLLIKYRRKNLIFILNSVKDDIHLMFQSLYAKADDFIVKNQEDMNDRMKHWIEVAIARKHFKVLIDGRI